MKLTKKQKKINKKERYMKTKAYAKKQLKKQEKQKDKEWRIAIMEKFNYECVICPERERINAHHIIPRTFKETRWDILNGVALCSKHHKFGKFSAHKNPLWFFDHLKILGIYINETYLLNLLKQHENNI